MTAITTKFSWPIETKTSPYGKVLDILGIHDVWGQTASIEEIVNSPTGAASIFKNFFFRGCETSNIMDFKSISKTFPYGEVSVSIGQLRPEIWFILSLPVQNLF